MNKTPRSYSKEFKRDAVRLIETSGKPKTQIARDVGVSDSALSRWLKEYGQAPEPNANDQGAALLDTFSRRIIGLAMSAYRDEALVMRRCGWSLAGGSYRSRQPDTLLWRC